MYCVYPIFHRSSTPEHHVTVSVLQGINKGKPAGREVWLGIRQVKLENSVALSGCQPPRPEQLAPYVPQQLQALLPKAKTAVYANSVGKLVCSYLRVLAAHMQDVAVLRSGQRSATLNLPAQQWNLVSV